MKEIRLQEIKGFRIGSAENAEAGTGCTVIICPQGAPCSVDVRGGGPASRESELLNPVAAADRVHAVLLSGGSAYGLDAAGGVMRYLEEKGIGLPVGEAIVPLVVEACIFDLTCGQNIRPDLAMGYAACVNAEENPTVREGNHGVGTGATVGKLMGEAQMMKSGLGTYAIALGELQVGAIVAVNALGDVIDDKGEIIAGMRRLDGTGFADTRALMLEEDEAIAPILAGAGDAVTNTTIGAVITNGRFDKTQLKKVAALASNGIVRAIRPVNTTADGDSVFALSVGVVDCDINVAGTAAAYCMEQAVRRAVLTAESAYGAPAAKDMKKQDEALGGQQ